MDELNSTQRPPSSYIQCAHVITAQQGLFFFFSIFLLSSYSILQLTQSCHNFSLSPNPAQRVLLQFHTHPDCALAPIQTQFSLEKYIHTHTHSAVYNNSCSRLFIRAGKQSKAKLYTASQRKKMCVSVTGRNSLPLRFCRLGIDFRWQRKTAQIDILLYQHTGSSSQQPVAACCVIHMAKCALLLYYVYHAHQRAGESKGKWRIAFSQLPCTAFEMHTDEINTQTDDIRAPLFFFVYSSVYPFFSF